MHLFTKYVRQLGVVVLALGFVSLVVPAHYAEASTPYVLNVTSPTANGSYKDGDIIDITVQFSEAVDVSGSPFLGLNTGSTANFTGGSGTDTLTFEYNVWFGLNNSDLDVNYIALNGGSIVDTATGLTNADIGSLATGASYEGSLAFNKDLVIDNTAPTVTGAVMIGLHTVIVSFSEIVNNNTSGAYSNFGGALAGKTITGVADNSNSNYITLTFDGDSLAGAGTGSLDISSVITDAAGNAFAGATNVTVDALETPDISEHTFHDVDHSGTFTEGDTIAFYFTLSMDTGTISSGNVSSRLGLSNSHTFGTDPGLAWTSGNKILTVTLGASPTVITGDTVELSAEVLSVNSIPALSPSQVTLTTNVWYAEYWNSGMPGIPDTALFDNPAEYATNIPGVKSFAVDLDLGSPVGAIGSDYFAGRLTQTSYFEKTGYYRFAFDVDDGIKLYVDDGLALSAWQLCYVGYVDVFLTEGYHTVKVLYFENDGFSHFSLGTTYVDTQTETATFSLAPAQSGSTTTYYNSEPLQFSFVLPEVMAAGSLSLTFTPVGGGDPIIFSLMDAVDSQTNPFSLQAQGGFGLVPEIVTASASSIPNGLYDITLAYQDALSNPATGTTISNITITDAPTVTTTGGITLSFGNSGGYVPSVGSSVGSSNPTNVQPDPDCLPGYKFSPTTGKACTSTPATPTTKQTFTKDLKLGMVDDDVARLQKFLNSNGFPIAQTGPGSLNNEVTTFGKKTQQALIKYQKANNITPASGLFGPKTRGVVNSQL